MPEQISNNQENPDAAEPTTADKLADEAVAAFEKKDFSKLDEAILRLGQEVGVELETEIEEALEKNQATYDWLFGPGKFNLKKEYLEGNLKTFSREQQKQIERSPYTEVLIIPGNISRAEFIEAVNQKYKQEFGKEIWYSDQAKQDLLQTQTAKQNPRPQTFYMMALKSESQTKEILPLTTNQTLSEQLTTLKNEQAKQPGLNLKGMTLPEALLFDAYLVTSQAIHADDSSKGWSYNRLLEELVLDKEGNPARALGARWGGGASGLRVHSDALAFSLIGARLAAVSS